jgi:hypothetical protein
MHPTKPWLAAARSAAWFRLDRHDDPDPEPEAPEPGSDDPAEPAPAPEDPGDKPGDGDPDSDDGTDEPEGADQLGDAGKRALDKVRKERAAARKEAAEARQQVAALAKKVQEFEDRDKSELQRAQEAAERAAQAVTLANGRAVTSEVKAMAVGRFIDVADAVERLTRDPSRYIGDGGDIDTGAIEADIAELLEQKPHWAAPAPSAQPAADPGEPAKKKTPRPDPGQGARPKALPKDFRTASKEELDAELARYGVRSY